MSLQHPEPGIWTEADLPTAERRLGRAPLVVPGLPIVGMEVGEVEGTPAVRVRQELEGGAVLALVQRREEAPFEAWTQVRRGGVWVAASARISRDSLRALVGRLR